jgi:glycosyltransferase involved in cell wall biosynthesis
MVSQFYPPIMGGEERHVYNLSRGLAARGHAVAVVTLATDGDESIQHEDGIAVWRVCGWSQRLMGRHRGSERPYAPPVPDPGVMLRLHQIVREFQPDVIHGHNWLINSAYPVEGRSIPIVSTLHNYGHKCVSHRMMHQDTDPCDGPSLLKCVKCSTNHYGRVTGPAIVGAHRLSAPLRQRRTAAFISVSQSVAQYGRGSDRDVVIPNFIPSVDEIRSVIAATPRPDFLPEGEFALFVGDVTTDKGVEVLLAAWRSLSPDCSLVFLGRTHGLAIAQPGVILAGAHDHDLVLAAMAAARFVVVPSLCADACPTVVLEAMASGTAVIGSNTGGIPDMIDPGVTGLLVPPSDVKALAGAMATLLGDHSLTERLAAEAQVRVKEFTVPVVVEEIEAVYRRVMPTSNVVSIR